MREDKGAEKAIPTASCVLDNGTIIEMVYSPEEGKTAFAISRGGEVTLEQTALAADGQRLSPISGSNNLLKHTAILLPRYPEPYASTDALLEEIQSYLHRYVDLSDAFLRITSCYVLLSWVYDAFNELPYLRLRGDYGSGKTRALLVIGSICYKAFFASGASTVSPIFHTLNTFQGTLIFDETDFRFSDERSELVKIFNNGNVRGFPVLRTAITQKREFDPRAFLVYGPKIVAMRGEFDDRALESRFITEEMGQRALRKDIPINLPECQKDEAAALRNKLLMYRFRTLSGVSIKKELVDPALSPRLNQILMPLLSIIEPDAIKAEIREAARGLDQMLRDDKSCSPEGQVLEVISELMTTSDRPSIPLSDVTGAFMSRYGGDYDIPITNRYIGRLVRTRLRLRPYKSHGTYVIPRTETPKIAELCIRYGLTNAGNEIAPAGGG